MKMMRCLETNSDEERSKALNYELPEEEKTKGDTFRYLKSCHTGGLLSGFREQYCGAIPISIPISINGLK